MVKLMLKAMQIHFGNLPLSPINCCMTFNGNDIMLIGNWATLPKPPGTPVPPGTAAPPWPPSMPPKKVIGILITLVARFPAEPRPAMRICSNGDINWFAIPVRAVVIGACSPAGAAKAAPQITYFKYWNILVYDCVLPKWNRNSSRILTNMKQITVLILNVIQLYFCFKRFSIELVSWTF